MLGVNEQARAQVYAIRHPHVHLAALEGQTHACLYWTRTLHGGPQGSLIQGINHVPDPEWIYVYIFI